MLEFDWEKFREQQKTEEREIGERASPPTMEVPASDPAEMLSQSATPPEDYALTPSDEMEDMERYNKEDEKDADIDLGGEVEALELEGSDSEMA